MNSPQPPRKAPQLERIGGGTPKKGVSVIQAANRLRNASGTPNRHASTNLSTLGQGAAGASGSGAAAAPQLVIESQRFEEWMKIATDNKITSTNTWNLALIDYFHEGSLLRNADDNSINFQKASCTLDGCVKIWTSRVDSVATETGKLLSGLAEDGRAGDMDDRSDEDGDDDDDEAREARKAKRKTFRQAATLADTFDKIKVKAFDLEFTVDPLFKKTSADFDEGGAGGILMNHLGTDGSMRVVFDAGDAKLEDVDEENDDADEEGLRLDISKLKAKYFPTEDDDFSTKTLCPSLSAFRFSADTALDLGLLVNPIDDILPVSSYQRSAAHATASRPTQGGSTHELGTPFGGDDTGGDVFGGQDFGGGGDDDFGGGGDGGGGGEDFFSAEQWEQPNAVAGGSGAGRGAEEAARPGGSEMVITQDGAGEGMFDYFDAKQMKNWAGPEHWKMRRVAGPRTGAAGEDGAPRQKKEKTAFAINFSEPPALSQKELFAAAPAASLRVPRKAAPASGGRSRQARSRPPAQKEEEFVLPDDIHFSSQVLLRLFLKPKTSLKIRRRGPAPTTEGTEAGVDFWAQTGGEGGGGMEDDLGGEDNTFGEFDGPAPFQTQLLNEDDDDFDGYAEFGDGEGGGDEEGGQGGEGLGAEGEGVDLMQEAGQLHRVRPENVNYAKKAKRVDIKKLKDTIWKELQQVAIEVDKLPAAPSYLPEPDADAEEEEKKPEALIPVVEGLRKLYPEDKMEEVSTSFCFICLLHLANEKGLRIQTPLAAEGPVDDGLLMRKQVGGLEGLRVFREVAVN